MRIKNVIMAASMALGLASFAAAVPASADSVLNQTVNRNSTFFLIGHGGHGGGGYGGHVGGYHGGMAYHGGHAMGFRHFGGPHFAGHFRGRPFFHHHRFHRRFFVFGGPFFYGDYYGGSCYWNCRQYHGPHFCRLYAYDYCY